jgi:hypothetical protein
MPNPYVPSVKTQIVARELSLLRRLAARRRVASLNVKLRRERATPPVDRQSPESKPPEKPLAHH